jgi:hypothetical protein
MEKKRKFETETPTTKEEYEKLVNSYESEFTKLEISIDVIQNKYNEKIKQLEEENQTLRDQLAIKLK